MNEYECRYLFYDCQEKPFIEWIKSLTQKDSKEKIAKELIKVVNDIYNDFFIRYNY